MSVLGILVVVFLIATAFALLVAGQLMWQMITFITRIVGVAFALAIAIIVVVALLTHGALI
jgi:hypothetical protein